MKIKLNKKKMLIGAGILAAGVAVFLIVRSKRKGNTAVNAKKEQEALQKGKTTVSAKSDASGSEIVFDADAVYPLKKGDTGTVITTLQHALNKVYNAGLSEDGIFGPKTEAACLQYLGSAQVTADKALALLVQYNNAK